MPPSYPLHTPGPPTSSCSTPDPQFTSSHTPSPMTNPIFTGKSISISPSPILSPISNSSIAPTPPSSSPRFVHETTRRPSPWHEIEHSLSTASLPRSIDNDELAGQNKFQNSRERRLSSQSSISMSVSGKRTDTGEHSPTLTSIEASGPSSQALRDWDRLLSNASTTRHQLVHSSPSLTSPSPIPKLSAERDKAGHIEYKLKLIDPTPERFERLVTQMMWRLKQGRNEAIYELGIADDGTVIGLTRAEMDASLTTLELMASEVGATVIVLKEIVLSGSALNPPRNDSFRIGGKVGEQVKSLNSSSSSFSPPAERWVIRRPDLDEMGRPRRGTKSLSSSGPEQKSKRQRAKFKQLQQQEQKLQQCVHPVQQQQEYQTSLYRTNEPRRIETLIDVVDDEDDDFKFDDNHEANYDLGNGSVRRRLDSMTSSDDDLPTFHLDLDESSFYLTRSSPSVSISSGTETCLSSRPLNSENNSSSSVDLIDTVNKSALSSRSLSLSASPSLSPSPHTSSAKITVQTGSVNVLSKKSEAKRIKSAIRREQRRLDLLRGDGTSPFPIFTVPDPPSQSSPTFMLSVPSIAGETIGNAPLSSTAVLPGISKRVGTPVSTMSNTSLAPDPSAFRSPHQPGRSSSLRLAEPNPEEQGVFLDSLLHIPLDSLSLSFADVQTVPKDLGHSSDDELHYATSPSTETETELHVNRTKREGSNSSMSLHMDMGVKDMESGLEKKVFDSSEEMICVEALVVRKVQHGHGMEFGVELGTGTGMGMGMRRAREGNGVESGEENWEGDEEEVDWGFGGEDDGWGLGGAD